MSESQPVIPDKPIDDDDILLTAEEREALGEDDADADEGEGEEGSGEAEAEASPEAPAAPSRDDGADPAPEPVNVPLIQPGDTDAAKARIAAIEGEQDALAARFDDGDLTAKEYQAALRALESERGELDWTLRKSSLSAEMQQAQAEQAWFGAVNEFLGDHPEIKANKTRLTSFDAVVRDVTGDPANNALTGRQKLEKAFAQWSDDLGIAKPAAPKPAAPRKPLPPNLSRIPASAPESTDDGRFGALERLAETNPLEYEKRVAAMSDTDREAFLSQ